MTQKLLGIDLGGTTIKFGILTLKGEVQEKWAIDTNILEDGKHIVPDIVASLKHRLGLYGLTKDDFVGIGMGSPGAVDREAKTVTGAFNLNWAHTEEVGYVIERELGIPFAIDNDANVAALGERWVGAGANNPDVVFVTLGTGVGGGVIADGNLIHGVAGAGGEIGHMIIEPDNGFECTCGIPGSTGGAVYMNAGAYGGEISEVLVEVDVVTKAGRMYTLNNEDLNLSYRHSDLQETGDIVVEARFKLKKGDLQSILAKMDELTYLRESKQPLEYPSCGSVFKRPEGHFTGKLIQEAELQGYTIGGAQISKKHAGFIINVGGATATDYINMIHHIQEVIWDLNKVALEPEVRILGKRSKYDTVDAAFGN